LGNGKARQVHDQALEALELPPEHAETISRRIRHLVDYQDLDYAERYVEIVKGVRDTERRHGSDSQLTETVAKSLHQLMTYKDEYEVARLLAHGEAEQRMIDRFDGKVRVERHLHPPVLRWLGVGKIRVGTWTRPLMALLYRMRRLRGRPWDLFGFTACRRVERSLIDWYVQLCARLVDCLDAKNFELCTQIAAEAQKIRGFEEVKIEAAERIRRGVEAQMLRLNSGPSDTEAADTKRHQVAN
jgi:indolepyruvate ferredoxin oxidoreductase